MIYSMAWLTDTVNGRQNRRNIDQPFDLASNAPILKKDGAEKREYQSPSSTSAAAGPAESSIAAVMRGAKCTRNGAIKAQRESDVNIPFAILDILQPVEKTADMADEPKFGDSDIQAVNVTSLFGPSYFNTCIK